MESFPISLANLKIEESFAPFLSEKTEDTPVEDFEPQDFDDNFLDTFQDNPLLSVSEKSDRIDKR